MRKVALAGAFYFAILFSIAFALGAVRTLLLESWLGETWAVACEAPFLILAMIFAARRALRMLASRSDAALLGVGVVAVVLQQIAEFTVALAGGESIAQRFAYFATAAGWIYLGALAVFLFMPLFLGRKQSGADR